MSITKFTFRPIKNSLAVSPTPAVEMDKKSFNNQKVFLAHEDDDLNQWVSQEVEIPKQLRAGFNQKLPFSVSDTSSGDGKNLTNQKEFLHLKTADACAMRITHGSRGRQQIYLCCMKLKTLPIPEFNVECIKNPIRRRKIDYKANNADKFTPIMARPLPIPNQS